MTDESQDLLQVEMRPPAAAIGKSGALTSRFWIEMALGVLSAIVLVLTLTTPDWIEHVLDLAPDGGNGSTEWGLAISLAFAMLAPFLDAARLRLRLRMGQASASTK